MGFWSKLSFWYFYLFCLFIRVLQLFIGSLAPGLKEKLNVFHSVICEEQSSHCIQKIFIPMKIFFSFDKLEFKLLSNLLVLQSMVILNIIDKFFQKVSWLIFLDHSILDLVFLIFFWEILACNRCMVIVSNIKYLNKVSFLSVASLADLWIGTMWCGLVASLTVILFLLLNISLIWQWSIVTPQYASHIFPIVIITIYKLSAIISLHDWLIINPV